MARPGRKRRGVRAQITVRVPVEHLTTYEARAREAGISLGDYFALAMATGHGFDVPDYIQRDLNKDRAQEELPLAQTA